MTQACASLLLSSAVVAALPAVAAKSGAHFTSAEGYPFRDGYPIPRRGGWGHRGHSLLSIPQTRVRNGERFDVNIRLYNDGGEAEFYNIGWDRLLTLPGCLALYDASRHYLCDLVQFVQGSHGGIGPGDWSPISAPGHADATLSVSIPYPVDIPVPAGTYYLQVIYLPCAVEPAFRAREPSFYARTELFRSNAVKITVLD